MHTVVETPAFIAAAKTAGMTEVEVREVIDTVSENPNAGDPIQGTGGCRKIRQRGRGRGKSGGYRVITFYSGKDLPVFLLTVFGKGERADLSMAEKVSLAAVTKAIVVSYRTRVKRTVK
jgi:hypothetical protein